MEYILVSPYTEYIEEQFDNIKRIMEVDVILGEPKDVQERNSKSYNKYIQVIIYLTLQFIMGHYVECLSEELYQETQIVNATACEFMELIIRSISQFSPDYCTEIMHMIIKPLLINLRSAIDNKNDA